MSSDPGSARITAVGNKRILASGAVVGSNGEAVSFNPFPNSPSQILEFLVEYSDNDEEPSTHYDVVDASRFRITHRRKWEVGNLSSLTNPSAFAKDSTNVYKFSYNYSTVGQRDDHAFTLIYTITAEPLE